MQRVTILGLGIIGSAWAQNLHADGLPVRAWNRSPKKLAYFEGNLRTAVEGAELIIMVVADPPAVSSILDDLVPCLKPGVIVSQSSTISARWTLEFAKRVEATGALFLEAPFTGGKAAAEARKTVYYLGGEPSLIEKARPVLSALASTLMHVGPLGTASTLKLAMNLNLAMMAEALCESLTLARSAGLSDDKFFEGLHLNSGRSGFSDFKEPKLKESDYLPQFSLKNMDKDLRLALETAGNVELPGARCLKALYDKGMQQGMTEDDFIGVIRLLTPSK